MSSPKLKFTRLVCGVSFVLLLSMSASTVLADGSAALKMAPNGANAVMTIDVAKLIASPVGKAADLESKLISGYADRPLAVPATARNLTLVAGVHPAGMDTIWEVAIVELSHEPKLDRMVGAQGGYLDTIEGKPAAWTKNDIYYVQLDKQTMGVVRPAHRQFVSHWLAGKNTASPSAYLTSALSAGADADVVFAVDMDGVVAGPATRYALSMGDLPSLEKMEPAAQSKLLAALASVKGMKITMKASDKLNAEWVIDFGQDVSALGNDAEAFVGDVLIAAGLSNANADKWAFKATGKKIVGAGTMDFDGLTRLIGLLAPGGIPATDANGADAAAPGGTATPAAAAVDPQKAPAVASQKYYRAITKSLDGISAKISPTQGAVWLSAQAKMIEQLPVLNVDPALLAWGNQVADAYRRAGQELALGQMNAKNAAAGVASPTGGTVYDSSGNSTGGDTADSRAAFRNAQQQRRQAAQTERASAAQRAIAYFNQLAPMRGQLRADMAQKYGVEF